MNELRVFQSAEFGELGVLEIDGKTFFPATECAKVLGYRNPRDAIKRHCKKEGYVKRDGVSQTTNQYGVTTEQVVQRTYIDEGNLYRLIVGSRLPAAERFERWVFDEVLPGIRQTGGYGDLAAVVARTAQETARALIRELAPLLMGEEAPPKRRIRHRSQGVAALDTEVRQDIEDMILCHRYTYTEIAELVLARYGIKTSKSAIGRYANLVYDRVERCQ